MHIRCPRDAVYTLPAVLIISGYCTLVTELHGTNTAKCSASSTCANEHSGDEVLRAGRDQGPVATMAQFLLASARGAAVPTTGTKPLVVCKSVLRCPFSSSQKLPCLQLLSSQHLVFTITPVRCVNTPDSWSVIRRPSPSLCEQSHACFPSVPYMSFPPANRFEARAYCAPWWAKEAHSSTIFGSGEIQKRFGKQAPQVRVAWALHCQCLPLHT